MPATKTIKEVQVVGGDKPDFVQEVFRGKQIWGYQLEFNEYLTIPMLMCVENPPSWVWAREPLAPGESTWFINPVTGGNEFLIPAGWDVLYKGHVYGSSEVFIKVEYYINDTLFGFWYSQPGVNAQFFAIGQTKSFYADVNKDAIFKFKLTNLGNDYLEGTFVLLGFTKPGVYEWR